MNETSFICEHSAEFVLVHYISKLFSTCGQNLIPLYFWKNREGSSISKKCGVNMPIRLIAMYARRPKIILPEQKSITITINQSLFDHAKYLGRNGIPTIIGVPLISTIMDLQIGCPCSWFSLSFVNDCISHIDFSIDIDKNQCDTKLPSNINGPLKEEQILNLFNKSKVLNSWEEAIELLRCHRFTHFNTMFQMAYKPVYFINKGY